MIDAETRNRLIAEDSSSANLIKPFLAGRDIKRYQPPVTDKFLILMPSGWTREQSGDSPDTWAWLQTTYPAIAGHLAPYAEAAQKRYDKGEYWWELRSCAYYEEFEEPKIIYQVFQVNPKFTLDLDGFFSNNAIWSIGLEDYYLLAILNSTLGWKLISTSCSQIQRGYQLIWKYLEKIPIFIPDTKNRKSIEDKSIKMLELNKKSYESTNKFLRFIESSYTPKKLSDKLKAFYTLSFKEFIKELKKQNVALSKQDEFELMDVFETQKAKALAIQQEITATDAEIDRIVYDLYGLTDEEIRIVEGR